MRRIIQQYTRELRRAGARALGLNSIREAHYSHRLSPVGLSRRLAAMKHQSLRPKAIEALDHELTSALLARDAELAQILREVENISRNLKSNPRNTEALGSALRRTVLCAMKQSLLDAELRSLALTDDLTGIYNRRAFHALAGQQLKVARRNGRELLLFFADVDHLKNINDTFGHREGDRALVRVADSFERTFRNSDVIARLSGDEFAILALEASSRDQEAILRRLQEHLREVSSREERYKLTLSVGVVKFDPRRDVPLRELLAAADRAMYEEKRVASKAWSPQAEGAASKIPMRMTAGRASRSS